MPEQSDLALFSSGLLHSPKEGKPGEVDGEGDDVEQDAQQVHHQAQQHCLLTLMVLGSNCGSKIWDLGNETCGKARAHIKETRKMR